MNIQNYIQEYLTNFSNSFNIQYHSTIREPLEKKISILDLSIILDNLISNSQKANATELRLDFREKGVDISWILQIMVMRRIWLRIEHHQGPNDDRIER